MRKTGRLTLKIKRNIMLVMDKKIREKLANSMSSFHLPRYAELPNVGLYLEQTTTYINDCLLPLGCMEITASMVSNYVKKGFVANPIKKRTISATTNKK